MPLLCLQHGYVWTGLSKPGILDHPKPLIMAVSNCDPAHYRSYPCSSLLFVSLLLLHTEQTLSQFVNVRGERRLLFTAAGVRQAFTDASVGSISLAREYYFCRHFCQTVALVQQQPVMRA